MPAFMKTASWREKCISSRRGTFSRVISNWRMLFFSVTSMGARSRSTRARRAMVAVTAVSIPVTVVPSGVIALNLNLAMTSSSQAV